MQMDESAPDNQYEMMDQMIAYDVIVIGAGHAGCEAGLAAARAGARTLVLSPNIDRTGFMPCNPSIGGPGKSHLVAEVDALGGEMARAADRAGLQFRRLNTSKGPAVQAIRVQADKALYSLAMKEALENQDGLDLVQDEAVGLIVTGDRVTGIQAKSRGPVFARSVVITAGTFLRGALIAGESRTSGGRAGEGADVALSGSISDLGFVLRRLKTGTPPRIDGRTVDFSLSEPQPGSDEPIWMSHDGLRGRIEPLTLPPAQLHTLWASLNGWRPQLSCFRLATNPEAHDLIRANLHRAPMFNGSIEGVGPRYCPSIEDKVNKFADKPSHPVFLEPEGWRTNELYVQGMSTSLPFDVQEAALRTIPALRNVAVTRFGYAVEYDAVDPNELRSTLESRRIEGLFLAGQVNGTSGYEEAAGQGLLAGINASNRAAGREQIVLRRDQSYIGVMVDDLVNKPFDEPYRMLTSRAEYRLLLRPSMAAQRLAAIALDHRLITRGRFEEVAQDARAVAEWVSRLSETMIRPGSDSAAHLEAAGIRIPREASASDLLRRPELKIQNLLDPLADELDASGIDDGLLEQVEETIKYGDFIRREAHEVERHAKLESKPLPPSIDYLTIPGLRFEAGQKLIRHQPVTFGDARRLSGVTPSDIAALLIHATRLEAATR
jgi:tRNA uridine 5-carboxymethylaminomethyl modification enzyme